MTLNVLVLENEPDAGAAAQQELRDAGHTVLTCHEPGSAAFPCKGVERPSECPLRSHVVDVALVVRAGTRAQPTLGEDGARCALVHRVPLVVAGTPLFDPFDEYASRTIQRTYDVVDVCEAAAAEEIPALAARANEALAEIAERDAAGIAPRATVTRRSGRLQVLVAHGEHLTAEQRSRAAVRVLMGVRELDPFAVGVDVAFDGPGQRTP